MYNAGKLHSDHFSLFIMMLNARFYLCPILSWTVLNLVSWMDVIQFSTTLLGVNHKLVFLCLSIIENVKILVKTYQTITVVK